jgi:putative transposase
VRLACPEEPRVALHLVQRGLAACFSGNADCLAYLEALAACAAHDGCAVHAYALMGNHVHLLVTPALPGGATLLLRSTAERYARHVAQAHGYQGALWEERFDGTPVHARRYLFACMRYIEMNPVRAGLVREAGAYRWSSFRANALGQDDALVIPHPCYFALGRSREERCAAYRAQFARSEASPAGVSGARATRVGGKPDSIRGDAGRARTKPGPSPRRY